MKYNPHDTPVPLLLAAGASGRFGAAKVLACLDGTSLLARAIEALGTACGHPVRVVIGARAAQVEREVLSAGARPLENPGWRDGLASSIATGIAGLPDESPAVLVALADQVALDAADYRLLVETWREARDRIVAAHYSGRNGAPTVWPRRYFADLAALSGDAGARALLERHANNVTAVSMPGAAVDIDTRAELDAFVRSRRDSR